MNNKIERLSRRRLLMQATLAAALPLLAAGVTAQTAAPAAATPDYPRKPITLVVPYAPGGPTDQHVRVLAEEVGRILGQPLVMDNRPGASGTNGAMALARATPDGYTLAVLPAAVYREPWINKVSFDPKTSFTYVALLSDYAFGLAVKADSPWKSWQEFASDAAQRPGRISVGATGAVGTPRIVMDEIAQLAKLQFNIVPYKGDAELTNALLGGHIDAAVLSGVAVPHIEAGKMRYVAMLTRERAKRFPELRTLREQGVDAFVDSPYGIAAPAGMDAAQVRQLQDAFRQALATPASERVLAQLNQPVNFMASEDYRAYALEAHAREKDRVDNLRQKGLLD